MNVNKSDNSSSWQIEHLVRQAFARTKDRFLGYFLTAVLNFALWTGLFISILLLSGVLFFIYTVTKLASLLIILAIVLSILMLFLIVYISAWTQLTAITVIIQEEKLDAIETFKKVKPLVNGYLWFISLNFLFSFGLLPWGLLSLFTIIVLWSVWGVFSTFVYLQSRRKGLINLWVSRELVNQKFWGILGRMFLINLSVAFISMFLISSGKSAASYLITILLQLFTAPFVISFKFEMFKNLKEPEKVNAPKVWVALSIIGLVVLILLFIFSVNGLINWLPTVLKNLPPPSKFPQFIPTNLPGINSV